MAQQHPECGQPAKPSGARQGGRIKSEFEATYPEVIYETRPDATLAAARTERVIENDEAAQLLCAVYNAMPWLAVKRMTLFESENHPMIFSENVTASHVMFVDAIQQAVEAEEPSGFHGCIAKAGDLRASSSTSLGRSCGPTRNSTRCFVILAPRWRIVLRWTRDSDAP